MRHIDVEFGLKITDVDAAELAPLLETFARLAKRGKIQVSPETQRILQANLLAPPALAAPARITATNGAADGGRRHRHPARSREEIMAALERAGSVIEAATALGYSEHTLRNRMSALGIQRQRPAPAWTTAVKEGATS